MRWHRTRTHPQPGNDMPASREYLISIHQPDGEPPPREVLEPVMRELSAVDRDMKAAGAWVFSRGLFPATTATVLRFRDGEMLTTDGPFVEGKEHLGGIVIV